MDLPLLSFWHVITLIIYSLKNTLVQLAIQKPEGITFRTMEIFRQLGLEAAIRTASKPLDNIRGRIAVETIKSIDPEKLETVENSQKALEKERIENFEKVEPFKASILLSNGTRTYPSSSC